MLIMKPVDVRSLPRQIIYHWACYLTDPATEWEAISRNKPAASESGWFNNLDGQQPQCITLPMNGCVGQEKGVNPCWLDKLPSTISIEVCSLCLTAFVPICTILSSCVLLCFAGSCSAAVQSDGVDVAHQEDPGPRGSQGCTSWTIDTTGCEKTQHRRGLLDSASRQGISLWDMFSPHILLCVGVGLYKRH